MNNVIQLKAYKEDLALQNQETVLSQYLQLIKLSQCVSLSCKRVDLIMHETLLNEIDASVSDMFAVVPQGQAIGNFSAIKYKDLVNEVLCYAKDQPDLTQTYLHNLVTAVSTLLALEEKIPVEYDYGHDIFCRYKFDPKYLENNPMSEMDKLDKTFALRKLNMVIANQNKYVHNQVDHKIKLKM